MPGDDTPPFDPDAYEPGQEPDRGPPDRNPPAAPDKNPEPVELLDPGRFGMITRPTADVDVAQESLIYAQAHGFNLLAPAMRLDQVPPGHTFGIRMFRVPSAFSRPQEQAKSNGHVYIVDGGRYALHRSTLERLFQMAGMRDYLPGCKRLDDGSIPYLWQFQHAVERKDFSGRWSVVVRSAELDLRDGSASIEGWRDRRIQAAREHGYRKCESKASNAAIRAALGIPGSFSRDELGRPFVLPVLQWTPDMNDPQIARMVAAKELGVVQEITGSQGPIEISSDGLDGGGRR